MIWLCTDWNIKWDAVAAVMTGLGAFGAAWAAWEARGAAKAALQIDRQVADRAADREHRDSIPLAVAIQRELFEIYGLMHDLPRVRQERAARGLTNAELLRQISELHPRFHARTLEASILELGCFDAAVGRALGIAVAATQAFRGIVNVPGIPPTEDGCDHVLQIIMQESQRYFPLVRAGAAALTPLTGANVPNV
jgi:hypothetical protein